jgi:tRNA pseudouridine13 synthase
VILYTLDPMLQPIPKPQVMPEEPRILTLDLPAAGGCLGPAPEDFAVDELPLVEPSGDGNHLWVLARKRQLTTTEMVGALARAAGVPERDLGYSGMKDKHAVTSQWVSLPASCRPPDSWQLPSGIEVLAHARHGRKLRTGQHRGNRFVARLISVPGGSKQRAERILERLVDEGLPNYFGAQRFGRGGENLARALHWLSSGARAHGSRARFYRKLYPSVIQAEVFNRVLTARLDHRGLLEGDVVRLEGSGSVFVVDDPAREQPRLLGRDIHLTGPIFGPKMRAPGGAAANLESAAAAGLGLTPTDLELVGRLADGTRRDLFVFPTDVAVHEVGADTLMLRFSLPSGSYATQLLRELTRTPFWGRDR